MTRLLFTSAKHTTETARSYMRRVSNWLDNEMESLLDPLPSIGAVVDYFEMVNAYDVSLMEEVLECLEDGADPADLVRFMKHYRLQDHEEWADVKETVDQAYEVATDLETKFAGTVTW